MNIMIVFEFDSILQNVKNRYRQVSQNGKLISISTINIMVSKYVQTKNKTTLLHT